jgi:hypothetical protein
MKKNIVYKRELRRLFANIDLEQSYPQNKFP